MKPELLSPAGSMEALYAAAANGADAVYLGGKALNARRGAGNFDRDELILAGEYLHERGKRLHVTVNTVVKQSELGLLEDIAEQLYACRADAAIVQDAGVCEALKQMLPQMKLHASTQMAICNVQGAQYLRQKGFDRAVLAREMDLNEIRACSDVGIETEVFCHGALCVACSGQCLFSSLVGGRSGNRGQCAQPCRLPYELRGAISAKGYLLSPKDLCAAGILEQLKSANVASLKIEGRLKRPEYVAVVTGIYRRLLDGEPYSEEFGLALKQIFNRGGFTKGYALGIRDGEFLSVKRPSHWGVKAARASTAKRIDFLADIEKDDALVLRNDAGEEIPLKLSGKAFSSGFNPSGKTSDVYRLVSGKQMNDARRSYEKETPFIALNARCTIKTLKPAVLTLDDGTRQITVRGDIAQKAENTPFDEGRAAMQLQKTGGTPYFVDKLIVEADREAYVPVSALNRLRREAIEALSRARIEAFAPRYDALHECACPVYAEVGFPKPSVTVQSRDIGLLRRLLALGADEAVLEIEDIRQDALVKLDPEGLFLYLPPVLHSKTLARLNDFVLNNANGVRGVYLTNPAQLNMDWPGERRYDFTLNIANTHALSFLGVGESVYTPSVELTCPEINALGGKRELIVYGRIPLMRLRHCPLNAARGGGEHTSCRACDSAKEGSRLNDARFADRMNAMFPLRRLASDEGCIISLYNSVPLDLSGHMDRLPGARSVRLLFTNETPKQAESILLDFINAIKTNENIPAKGSFTTGHYFRKTE